MEFAFLDESGDLGAGGSNYLILTLVCTKRKKDLVRFIVDIKKKLLDSKKGRKWLNRRGGEVKFYGFPDKVLLKKKLSALSQIKMDVDYVVFKKRGKGIDYRKKEAILEYLFSHILHEGKGIPPMKVLADLNFLMKKGSKAYFILEQSLENRSRHGIYLIKTLGETEFQQMRNRSDKVVICIEHINSRNSEELQAVDLISGAIFQKYENDNREYHDLLSGGCIRFSGVEK